MSNLNPVNTTITIAGKPCHFVHIKLHQQFNSHHTFEIKVDYQELDTLWMANPTLIIQLIGKDVSIVMQHKVTGESNLFKGIITNISMNGQHGEQNYITIFGNSPTIKLDGTPTMDSFMDLTLQTIVEEAIGTSGNGGEVNANPKFKGKIDYITQYKETCFSFLNRLSWLYGEWFFYDGTTCYFGKPDLGDVAKITYDIEMTHFDLTANLIPNKISRFNYLNHDDNEVNADAPDTVDGVRGYIKAALDESKKIYTSEAINPLEASILSKKELDDLVKVDKYRMVSQMLIMKGDTHTCKIKIGKLISVGLPSNMRVTLKHVETFLVTEVTHYIDQDGTYRNTFTAIPSEMENIPMPKIESPTALPQIAWVSTNADSKGRIKVQTQWQKKINKTTNWIRVQTPDAGSSDKVSSNRGFVFIPEEGDLVMLNFENGDPNRPYVSGAMFSETASIGGGQSNKSKSLTTRTGSTVTLDDSQGQGSILIKDPSGNEILLDGAGNITITAPLKITLNSKEIHLNGEDLVQFKSDKMIKSESLEKIELGANQEILIHAETKVRTESPALIEEEAPKITTTGTTQVEITGGTSIDIKGTTTNIKGTPLNLN